MALVACFLLWLMSAHTVLTSAPETIEAGHITRAKQKAVPLTTASMGPVHVHNPGTVVFSLLGEFTGQIGQMTEGKTDPGQTDEVYCPMYPTASPTQHLYEELPRRLLPLSKEEHPEVSLPSQEQGKGSLVPIEQVASWGS
uniref:Uncharacterized protein n=1 Tax=Knipowitschia caucasica TaxID=637954 RepID=A0AAV2MC20_KNICA